MYKTSPTNTNKANEKKRSTTNTQSIKIPEFDKKLGQVVEAIYSTSEVLAKKYMCAKNRITALVKEHKIPVFSTAGVAFYKDMPEIYALKKVTVNCSPEAKKAAGYKQKSADLDLLNQQLYELIKTVNSLRGELAEVKGMLTSLCNELPMIIANNAGSVQDTIREHQKQLLEWLTLPMKDRADKWNKGETPFNPPQIKIIKSPEGNGL